MYGFYNTVIILIIDKETIQYCNFFISYLFEQGDLWKLEIIKTINIDVKCFFFL